RIANSSSVVSSFTSTMRFTSGPPLTRSSTSSPIAAGTLTVRAPGPRSGRLGAVDRSWKRVCRSLDKACFPPRRAEFGHRAKALAPVGTAGSANDFVESVASAKGKSLQRTIRQQHRRGPAHGEHVGPLIDGRAPLELLGRHEP